MGEDCGNCGSDCGSCSLLGESYCGDGVCNVDENSNLCPLDCAKKGGSYRWMIFLILILVLLVGIGFLLYYLYNKKQQSKPGVKPSYIPSGQRRSPSMGPRRMLPRRPPRRY